MHYILTISVILIKPIHLKKTGNILLLIISHLSLSAQYYFTGEVKGSHGDDLQRVSIVVRSTGESYRTGASGNFEIISRNSDDSLTFSADGYDNYTTAVSSNDFLRITLKELPLPLPAKKNRLSSVVNGSSVSFSCNSNGITYSNIKKFLDMGRPVPSEAVKVEEMLNYLNFYYEDPDDQDLFHCSSELVTCPWNVKHRLLCLNVCAKRSSMENTAPNNIVLLIDVTGSMDMPNKLPLVKSSLHLLVKNLRDIDTVSLVEYGGRGRVLAGVPGSEKDRLIRTIEQLSADGPSPTGPVLNLAYKIAANQFIPGGNNRIILFTDGDISPAPAAKWELLDLAGRWADDSIQLSCIGMGLNKEEPSELPELARAGHGTFACIGNAQQGETQLLDDLAKGLSGIADKVCFTVAFDTSIVQEYHLLGYDNRNTALKDTTLTFETGSVSSADAQLAIFEIIPKADSIVAGNIANVGINYCLPGQAQLKKMSYDCPNVPGPFEKASASLKRSICIALFGMKLKGADDAPRLSWADFDKMTRKVFSSNNYLDSYYISLVSKARRIYERGQ